MEKFINYGEYKKIFSRPAVEGLLIYSGLESDQAAFLAKKIERKLPQSFSEAQLFTTIAGHLKPENRKRYTALALFKLGIFYHLIKKPLFILIMGFGGKTILSNKIAAHLEIDRIISTDVIREDIRQTIKKNGLIWKSSYASKDIYQQQLKFLQEKLKLRIKLNLEEAKLYRRWAYLWEGIFLHPSIVDIFPPRTTIKVMIAPNPETLTNRYMVRWLNEYGRRKFNKNIRKIKKDLNVILDLAEEMKKTAKRKRIFIIESTSATADLKKFYQYLSEKIMRRINQQTHRRLEKITNNPREIYNFINRFETPTAKKAEEKGTKEIKSLFFIDQIRKIFG